MRARATALGHAIHPILIVYPLGLLSSAVIFDIIYFATDRVSFAFAAAHTTAVGVLGGVVAAIFGLIDWLAIPNATRAWRVGLLHGLGNGMVLILFAGSWLLRNGEPDWRPTGAAFALAVVGLAIAGVTGWLGGELVERLGVSVEPDAHLDATSSLSS